MEKRQSNKSHIDHVIEKKKQISKEIREKKKFLLVRQQLIRHEKQEELIALKRHIIKKCWRLHMVAEIILSQVVRKLFRLIKIIARQKEIKFRRQFAACVINEKCRKYLERFGDPAQRF